jgi:hypothetical protein
MRAEGYREDVITVQRMDFSGNDFVQQICSCGKSTIMKKNTRYPLLPFRCDSMILSLSRVVGFQRNRNVLQ